jgi:hypothetical protein
VSVVATLILAALAIWGQSVRAKLVGPKLTLSLLDPLGERIPMGPAGTPSRWYHLRVVNERRSAPAKNVRVVIDKVSRPSADGQFRPTALSGHLQLAWQHGNTLPQYPTLGPPLNADLGWLASGEFHLKVLIIPNHVSMHLKAGEKMLIEVLAVSDETESAPLCLEISWDGRWSEDSSEMARHLVIKPVEC